MISNRSYLLKALYDWVLDNECTPYIVVSTESKNIQIPSGYDENNRIVLNISPNAVRHFGISQHTICFESRFAGQAHAISAPVGAVIAIYAKETGEGMVFDFEQEESDTLESATLESATPENSKQKSAEEDGSGTARHLRIIK
ncbi:MAG: ClpXP protease specificity-enhancing factor [Pseudomonadales bacterium]|nr:ClpXP protease specificity-enhancing factor [Pseudomonadales bacterium]